MASTQFPTERLDDLLYTFRPTDTISRNEAKEALTRVASLDATEAKAVEAVLTLVESSDCLEMGTWKEIGRILNCSQQYMLSQLAYYNAYEICPDETEIKLALVYTFRQLRDHDKAIFLYSARLADDTEELSTIEKLANSFYDSGNFFEAVFFYKMFLSKCPGDPLKEKLLEQSRQSTIARNKKYEDLITFFGGVGELVNS